MAYSRFEFGVFLRVTGLLATLALLAWMIVKTDWYVTTALVTAALFAQAVLLAHFASRSGREVARFRMRWHLATIPPVSLFSRATMPFRSWALP